LGPGSNLFIAPLPITAGNKRKSSTRLVRFAGNCVPNCQLRNKVALENFTELSQDGGHAEFAKKISAPHPLMKINQMAPLSARSQWTVPLTVSLLPANRFEFGFTYQRGIHEG
jgi:hypothetical protein